MSLVVGYERLNFCGIFPPKGVCRTLVKVNLVPLGIHILWSHIHWGGSFINICWDYHYCWFVDFCLVLL